VAYPASHARTGSYPPQTRTGTGNRARNRRQRQAGKRWPLPVILGGQAVLTLTLFGRPVVQDEATYIDAGNAQIASWLHGAQTLPYPRFFSGAPVLYPPLSAALDGVGGLIATRLLSLILMLATTAVLWATARRLFGGQVPLFATVLFATAAAVQYMGALATYDALALFLLAVASWCAIRAVDEHGAARAGLLAGMCGLLLLANATKYASALWDPVVAAIAALAEARRQGWRAGFAVGAVTALATLVLLAIAALSAGGEYWQGVTFSTLNRTANDGTPASVILGSSARWVGLIAVLAVIGAIVLQRYSREPALTALGWVLTAAVFLAPLNQARIGVVVSLFKHIGFGAWFAAIPAGYAVAALFAVVAARRPQMSPWNAATGAAAGALAAMIGIGIYEAQGASDMPVLYSQQTVARIRPMLYQSKGPWLGDSPTVIIYYAHTSSVRWRNTYGFTYIDPQTGRSLDNTAAYTAAIRDHYFSVVVLRTGRAGNPVDKAIMKLLYKDPRYQLTVIRQDTGADGPTKILVWRLAGGGSRQVALRRHSGAHVLGGSARGLT
jgi:4-amino-4-deoxy-L-arabinose transferase-like glycosyltransferase